MNNFYCCDCVALAVAVISMVCNVIIVIYTIKQISPQLKQIHDSLSNTLERAKKKLIYERYFPRNKDKMTDKEFERNIVKTWEDIPKLIPNLNEHGKGQEDYYLAEWLLEERSFYNSLKNKDKEVLGKEIYKIRTGKGKYRGRDIVN